MSRIARLFMLLSLIAFTVSIAPSTLLAFDEPMLTIKTGSVSGVYYAAGSAIAKMHNRKRSEYHLRLITEASEGSVANIMNVADGSAAFGIAQANFLYFAKNGERDWKGEPQTELRSVLGLYTEAFTIIAGADSGIKTVADLKGKKVNVGELGSTDAEQAAGIFKALGLNPETDLQLLNKPTYEATELLKAGDIDAYFYTVGHPNFAVEETTSGDYKVIIVSPGRSLISKVLAEMKSAGRDFLTATDIPIDYYKKIANTEPIPSLGVKAILFTRADTDEEAVYHIVKEVYENLDLFKLQHPAFAEITPKKLTTGLIVPLHPGAKRYFKEAGLMK